MGANSSTLHDDDITEIVASSSFSRSEIERLYTRFQKLDRNGSGTIDAAEFLMIPELAMNPLVPRIVDIFDGVNFAQFVSLLSAFGPKATRESKVDFVFRFYDVDGDGLVNEQDIAHVFRLLVGNNLDDEMLERIVQKSLADARSSLSEDGSQDGGAGRTLKTLSRDEMARALQSTDLEAMLKISV